MASPIHRAGHERLIEPGPPEKKAGTKKAAKRQPAPCRFLLRVGNATDGSRFAGSASDRGKGPRGRIESRKPGLWRVPG